jgi:hypothetical protein
MNIQFSIIAKIEKKSIVAEWTVIRAPQFAFQIASAHPGPKGKPARKTRKKLNVRQSLYFASFAVGALRFKRYEFSF